MRRSRILMLSGTTRIRRAGRAEAFGSSDTRGLRVGFLLSSCWRPWTERLAHGWV